MSWLGAQTTIQRWYLDPLVDDSNVDRTLRTVFTHDHFGPSTHQQAGLYAGLLVEPKGQHGPEMTARHSALARTVVQRAGRREFLRRTRLTAIASSCSSFRIYNSRTGRRRRLIPATIQRWAGLIIANAINPPCYTSPCVATPSLITTGVNLLPAGTQSVNYTNEPIATRLGGTSAFPVPPGQPPTSARTFRTCLITRW